MQATQTGTIQTIQALRAISDRSIYRTEMTTPDRRRTAAETETTGTDAEAWARRAAHANGFGDAGI